MDIKFRAWVVSMQRMFHWGSSLISINHDLSWVSLGEGVFNKSDSVLMQYTGLKDKNGVDIYEGDIVGAPHDFGPGGFSDRTFMVQYHILRGYQWQYWDMDEVEIIGNIHENPELIPQ